MHTKIWRMLGHIGQEATFLLVLAAVVEVAAGMEAEQDRTRVEMGALATTLGHMCLVALLPQLAMERPLFRGL